MNNFVKFVEFVRTWWGALSAFSVTFPFLLSLVQQIPPPVVFQKFSPAMSSILNAFVFLHVYTRADDLSDSDYALSKARKSLLLSFALIFVYITYLIAPTLVDLSSLSQLLNLLLSLTFLAIYLAIFAGLTRSFTIIAAMHFYRQTNEMDYSSTGWMQVAVNVQRILEDRYLPQGYGQVMLASILPLHDDQCQLQFNVYGDGFRNTAWVIVDSSGRIVNLNLV